MDRKKKTIFWVYMGMDIFLIIEIFLCVIKGDCGDIPKNILLLMALLVMGFLYSSSTRKR